MHFVGPNKHRCGLSARVARTQYTIDVNEGHMWPVVIHGDAAMRVARSRLKASRERSIKQQ